MIERNPIEIIKLGLVDGLRFMFFATAIMLTLNTYKFLIYYYVVKNVIGKVSG
jgi:hypothetical protein